MSIRSILALVFGLAGWAASLPPSAYKNLGSCVVKDAQGNLSSAWEYYFANGGKVQIPIHQKTGGSVTLYCVQITDEWSTTYSGKYDACQDYAFRAVRPSKGKGVYGWTISIGDSTKPHVRINGLIPPTYNTANLYGPHDGPSVAHWYSDPSRDWEYVKRNIDLPVVGPLVAFVESTYTQHLSGTCQITKTGGATFNTNLSHMSAVRFVRSDTCSVIPNCKVCSWPYASVRAGCGCIVDNSSLQTRDDLRRICYAWAQTAGSSSQYYFDESRSNFDPSKGEIRCAASSPTMGTTLWMPAGKCPEGSLALPGVDTFLISKDSIGEKISGTINDKNTGLSGGSGSGSDTGTHSRLDSILGTLRDTAGLGNKLDTLRSWDSAFGAALGDTVGARDALRDLDSSIAGIPGSDGPCTGCVDPWRCDRIPNDSIAFDFFGSHFSIPLSFSDVVSGLPFDFWAVLRLLEWLVVTVSMLGPWLWIAGANVGKAGS